MSMTMEIQVVFSPDELLDITKCAQERNITGEELIRAAVLEDLYR